MMARTQSPLRISHLIGGLLGGLLAGGSAGILILTLIDTDTLTNVGSSAVTLFIIVLIGSGILGAPIGIYYREARGVIWIALFAAIQVLFIWLGSIGMFVFKEALGIKGAIGILAMPFGALVSGWIGQVINSQFLLPKVRERVSRSKPSLEK